MTASAHLEPKHTGIKHFLFDRPARPYINAYLGGLYGELVC